MAVEAFGSGGNAIAAMHARQAIVAQHAVAINAECILLGKAGKLAKKMVNLALAHVWFAGTLFCLRQPVCGNTFSICENCVWFAKAGLRKRVFVCETRAGLRKHVCENQMIGRGNRTCVREYNMCIFETLTRNTSETQFNIQHVEITSKQQVDIQQVAIISKTKFDIHRVNKVPSNNLTSNM